MHFCKFDQPNPILVHLQNQPFVILKNLPGQRMGAKQWFEYLREHLKEQYNFQFCSKQPCLARHEHGVILIHVDDVLSLERRVSGTTLSCQG